MKSLHTTKYSIIIAIALIVYFVAVDLLGFANYIYLSFFNAAIVGVGLFFVIRDVYQYERDRFKYMDGFVAGLKAGFVATLIYTVFMAIYLYEINPDLALEIQKQITIAGRGIKVAMLLFIFLSGIATTIVLPLVILPVYKRSWNTREVRHKQKPMNQ